MSIKLITFTYGHDKPGDGVKKEYTALTNNPNYRTGDTRTVPATSRKGKRFNTLGTIKHIENFDSAQGKERSLSLYEQNITIIRHMPEVSIRTLPGYVMGSTNWGVDSQTRRNQARQAFGGTMRAPHLEDNRQATRLITRGGNDV